MVPQVAAAPLLLLGLACSPSGAPPRGGGAAAAGGLTTNEVFIRAMPQPLDVRDSLAVLRYVFERLDSVVTVFPSENYYYYRFTHPGGEIAGSLALFTRNRDDGILSFSYTLQDTADAGGNALGGGGPLGVREGVRVTRAGPFAYNVAFAGRTVCFRLHVPNLRPLAAPQLRRDETWVGPSSDESGLRFHLVFNEAAEKLYWVLDEADPVPEVLAPAGGRVLVGTRTRFAFYDDREQRRRIMIGAYLRNIEGNTWYDGPFDQMPDNYVYAGRIEVQRFIERAYPEARGLIDRYGSYLENPSLRVPVANYRPYHDVAELVAMVEACRRREGGGAAFYSCITVQP